MSTSLTSGLSAQVYAVYFKVIISPALFLQEYTPSGCEDSLIEFAKFQDIIKHVKLTPEQYTHMCSDLDTAKEFIKMNY